jgi:phosphocarrier protein
MQAREITIMNRLGLHARAAAKLVSLSSKYVSSVVLVVNGRRANARHMIAVLLLSAGMAEFPSRQQARRDRGDVGGDPPHQQRIRRR